jgi:hypothetical protein
MMSSDNNSNSVAHAQIEAVFKSFKSVLAEGKYDSYILKVTDVESVAYEDCAVKFELQATGYINNVQDGDDSSQQSLDAITDGGQGLAHPADCDNCGELIETAVGSDDYTQVTHYTTTDYSKEYYCDEQCLIQSLQAASDHSGGGDQ